MERLHNPYVLHQAFLEPLNAVRAAAAREKLPMDVYEAFRSALRQENLELQGRKIPGPGATPQNPLGHTVTKAGPWWSFHQFGLAVDMVFYVDGRWTWSEPEKGMWDRYTEICHANGLRTLSFERPHCEFPAAIDALRRGEYPPDGGSEWEDELARLIAEWQTARPGTFSPPLPHQRPGLEVA